MGRIKAFPQSATLGAGEIDLRDELSNMFFGSQQEIPKAHNAILRRMRRDSNDQLVPCECRDSIIKEGDIDHKCPFCLGEHFLWDEEWVSTRRVFLRPSDTQFVGRDQYLDPGLANVQAVVYFFEYSVEPTRFDRVVEMKLNTDGTLYTPYKRLRIYKPENVIAHLSNNGRTEYYSVYCQQKDSIAADYDDKYRV